MQILVLSESCDSERDRRLGGYIALHVQLCLLPSWPGLLFETEVRGNIFLRNIGLPLNLMVLQPTGPHSSEFHFVVERFITMQLRRDM
jgi:hypothetical protein